MVKIAFPHPIPVLLPKAKRFSQGFATLIGELGFEPNTLQEVDDLIASISALDQLAQAGRGELNQGLLRKLRQARAEIRAFATEGRDLLKPHLGRQWNLGWMEAGFRTPGSLAIPASKDQQEALVTALAAYLESHPQHENKPAGITGEKARSAVDRLASAAQAVAAAQDALSAKIEQRDLEVRRLRVSIRNLINRLRLVLPKDDRRWALMDLKAPADSKSPESSTDLTVIAEPLQSVPAGEDSRLAA